MDTNGDIKMLLLKDLCSRLPYGVMLNIDYYDLQGDGKLKNRDVILSYGNVGYCSDNTNWVSVKPYLRPMSSMTEEEEDEFFSLSRISHELNEYGDETVVYGIQLYPQQLGFEVIDWLNAHHFDYRGLISMGLAIEVTSENNPYKE